MSVLGKIISPVPVYTYYHPYPQYLAVFDAILVRRSNSRFKLIVEASQKWINYMTFAMYARRLLEKKNVEKDRAILVSTLAINALASKEITDDLGLYSSSSSILSKLTDYISTLSELPDEEIIAKIDKWRNNITIVPVTLEEYFGLNNKLKTVPETAFELAVEKILSKHKQYIRLYKSTLSLASSVADRLLAQQYYSAYQKYEALQQVQRAKISAFSNVYRIVTNPVLHRYGKDVDTSRGTRTQGYTGTAGVEVEFTMLPPDDAFGIYPKLAHIVASKITTAVRKNKLITSIQRRDQRIADIYIPGPMITSSEKPVLIIGVDTSGSVSVQELKTFVTELTHSIPYNMFDEKLSKIVYWDTAISKTESLRDEHKPPSGGGTEPAVFFEYLDKYVTSKGIRKKKLVMLFFSDGEFYFPASLKRAFTEYSGRRTLYSLACITSDDEIAEKIKNAGWDVVYKKIKPL